MIYKLSSVQHELTTGETQVLAPAFKQLEGRNGRLTSGLFTEELMTGAAA